MERARAGESYGDDYTAFLRSCEMRIRLFAPSDPAQVAALSRTHSAFEPAQPLEALVRPRRVRRADPIPGIVPLAVECRDRFGDYGIVGFASVDERPDVPLLRDLALSCRVAQKRVEHAFFGWLAQREDARGHARVRAELVRTSRNGPLVRVFDELPFEPVASADERTLMEMRTDAAPEPDDVVTLEADVAL
jgi:predicted enzyme involved in methoxymalonyl-ACP biosynthesis